MNRQSSAGLLIFITVISLSFLSEVAIGATPNTEAQREIDYLFTFLETSDCEFNRNGTWYDGKDAVSHINRKYQYLLKKGLVSTTESFIERAASKSSMSGRAYQVRCGNNDPVASKDWFFIALEKMRTSKP